MLDRPKQIQLIRRAESYLGRVLGTAIHIHATRVDRALPFHITDQYGFFEGPLTSQPCLFLVVLADVPAPPTALEKHIKTVQERFPHRPVLLVLERLDSRSRARLIAHQIGFVVPEFQLYAPMLAVDLRERGMASDTTPERFSPSAQLLVLAYLLHTDIEEELASRLALRLRTTAMSMSRAFAEVAALDLAIITPHGKERRLTFKFQGRALWDKVLPYLRSPVRKCRGLPFLPDEFPGLVAGETALSHYTQLVAPRTKSYAIAARQWKSLAAKFKLYYSHAVLEEDYSLETWSYDPAALSDTKFVDPLSLYLSIRNHGDERMSLAIDELLERTLT